MLLYVVFPLQILIACMEHFLLLIISCPSISPTIVIVGHEGTSAWQQRFSKACCRSVRLLLPVTGLLLRSVAKAGIQDNPLHQLNFTLGQAADATG